jgi:hypothetical protein
MHDLVGSILTVERFFYIYQDEGLTIFAQNGKFVDKKSTNYGKTEYMCSGISLVDEKLMICLKNGKICRI